MSVRPSAGLWYISNSDYARVMNIYHKRHPMTCVSYTLQTSLLSDVS